MGREVRAGYYDYSNKLDIIWCLKITARSAPIALKPDEPMADIGIGGVHNACTSSTALMRED